MKQVIRQTFLLLSFMLCVHISMAQRLSDVEIQKDYCAVPNKVVLSVDLPSNARNIVWYEIDNANNEHIITTDVKEYITKIAAGYRVSYRLYGTNYTTAVTSTASELVVNGDFEDGDTGFTTDYIKGTGASGKYNILKDASKFYGAFNGDVDHTTGDGYFMVVDGTKDKTVWEQTITVQPNTTYYLSAWSLLLYLSSNDGSEYPDLGFTVNGEDLTDGGNSAVRVVLEDYTPKGSGTNNWLDKYRFYGTWNSGNNTQAVVCIKNFNNNTNGNDFGLDDISFGTFAPPPVEIDTLLGNDPVCEGDELNISAIVTAGCSDLYEYQWINFTDPDDPILESDSPNLDIEYPTNAEHGGLWKLVVTDGYSTAELEFELQLLESPALSVTTSCVTKDEEGNENKDGQIFISSEDGVEYSLLYANGTEISSWSSTTQFSNLSSGDYIVKARYTDGFGCEAVVDVSLSSDMFTLLPPASICQGSDPVDITVVPSLCCYTWSDKTQKFPDDCTEDYTYKMSGSLFQNSLVEGYNTYTAGDEVSFKQVGIFKLDAQNDNLQIKDDGLQGFTYSIYKYPFNPAAPDENYIVTVEYDTKYSKDERAIKGLNVDEVYVVVANAPSALPACYDGLMYTDAGKMSTALFPDVNWYADETSNTVIATGPTVSTDDLGVDTAFPGVYEFYLSCCDDGCGRDKLEFTVNPVPMIQPGQIICSGTETNINPIVTDVNGDPIDESIFTIEYKWEVVSSTGIASGGEGSVYYQPDMNQNLVLEDGVGCGEQVYKVTARIGGSEGCFSEPTLVTVSVIDIDNVAYPVQLDTCVMPLFQASWNELGEPDTDMQEARPDYALFTAGDEALDFPLDGLPSCADDVKDDVVWTIIDVDGDVVLDVNGNMLVDIVGSPSTYPYDIKLAGDAKADVMYQIIYTITVACGDGPVEYVRDINVTRRPIVTKMNE